MQKIGGIMLKKSLVITAICSSLLSVGCSTTQSSVKKTESLTLLQNTNWVLTQMGATAFKTDQTALTPSIQFDAATQQLNGTDGCNRIMGSYTIKGHKLILSQLATTRMMCQNTMETANQYNRALAKVAGYHVYNQTLRLLDSYGNPVLQYKSGTQPR